MRDAMGDDFADVPPRARTRAEAAFAVLRTLIRGQVMFAGHSGVPLEMVTMLVDAPPPVLRSALERLIAEGVVTFAAGTLRLSPQTLAELRPAVSRLH